MARMARFSPVGMAARGIVDGVDARVVGCSRATMSLVPSVEGPSASTISVGPG